MRPYTINSLNFNEEKMVVEVETNLGLFELPVLPLPRDRPHNFILRYNGSHYEIRTKFYERFQRGEYSNIELLKLLHEPTHNDLRILSPAFAIGRFLLEKSGRDYEIRKLIASSGIDHFLKLDNVIEDVLSVELLVKLGFKRCDVEKAIPINDNVNAISEMLSDFAINPFKRISQDFENWIDRLHKTFWLYNLVEGSVILNLVKRKETFLSRVLRKLKVGNALFDSYNMSRASEIRSEIFHFTYDKLITCEDPIDKKRWLLEFLRLNSWIAIMVEIPDGFPDFDAWLWTLHYSDLKDLLKSISCNRIKQRK